METAGIEGARAFSRMLWHEIDVVGLVPDADTYALSRARWERSGAELWGTLREVLGASWANANSRLSSGYSSGDCARMLGLGAALAAYTAGYVRQPLPLDRRAIELGALANFLVAVYDQFLDTGVADADVLPRDRVAHVGRTAGENVACRSLGDPIEELFATLVGEYDRRLRELTGDNSSVLLGWIVQIILKMYDAERESLTAEPAWVQLRQRAALPFVVMGLPFWLTVSDANAAAVRAHACWLYRMGCFIGWIDDAIDLDDDCAAGRSNMVDRALRGPGGVTSHALAIHIAAYGRALNDEWGPPGGTSRRQRHDEVNGLMLTVCSWFGGVRPSEG